jgi:3-hydroxyacyl-CoA dehydrogenase
MDGLHSRTLLSKPIVERMELKHEVFAKLDRLTRPDAVLASNTSSLRIARLPRRRLAPSA